MIAPGERTDRSPETNQQIFDWLLDKVVPLGEHHLLFKLSANAARGQSHDIVGSKYELPPLVIDDSHSKAVRLTVLQEEEIDFTGGHRNVLKTNRKLSVDWRPIEGGHEKAALDDSETIFSAHDLSPLAQDRLLEVTEQYAAAALLLSLEEAKAKGFSDEAISYLGLNLQTPEI